MTFTASDASITPATHVIEVITGRSTLLGVPSPCPLTEVSGYQVCENLPTSNCTCHRHLARDDVALLPIEVLVLDAGLNPVLENDTLACRSCTEREVFFVAQDRSLVVCHENITSGTCECMGNTEEKTISGTVCSNATKFSTTAINGVASFSDVHILNPTVNFEGYKFDFFSHGVINVSFGITVIEGEAYALEVVDPISFPAPATSKTTFQSNYVTYISSPLDIHVVKVRILDGGYNFVGTTEPSGRQIFATCDTATLGDFPQDENRGGSDYAVSCRNTFCDADQEAGVAKFGNLRLVRPTAGEHVITFTGSGARFTESASYVISVIVGDPVALAVVGFTETALLATAEVAIPSFDVHVVDQGGNRIETANTRTDAVICAITGPRHNFDSNGVEHIKYLQQGKGFVTYDGLALGVPEVGEYNLTFTHAVLDSTVQNLTVTYGPSSRLYIPITFNTSAGVTIEPVTTYDSEIELVLSPLVVLILDGGLNYVRDASKNVTVTANRGEITYTVRNSSEGYVLFDDITLHRPSTGSYRFSFSSEGLTPVYMDVTVSPGYPAVLDVCGGNSFFLRNQETGVCEETRTYEATARVTLRSFQVRALDSGRVFVADRWNSERRSVSVSVESFTDALGVVHANSSDISSFVPDLGGTQDFEDGTIGWCTDGMDVNPVVTETIDPDTGQTVSVTTYSDSSPSYCREISYSGNAPDVHYNAGMKFSLPKAGIYLLKFTSECAFRYCGDVIYPNLETDTLQVRILPGRPAVMRFVTEPPAVNENDFRLEPPPVVEVFDMADNLCTTTNTYMSADLSPRSQRLHGNVAPVSQGRSTFPSLRFSGERGFEYKLIFELHAYGVTLEYSPFMLRPCETVKPNSFSDNKGRCHCLPGYTEDTVNGTGYVDDLDNYNVAGIDLYSPVVFDDGDWLEALHPYGICVPCANGYFKPHPGSHPCTKCKDRFDTSRRNGVPSPNHTSTSGKLLPGALGRTSEEDCHCIVQLPFESYYRNTSTHIKYKCEPCPPGGNCSGLDIPEIGALPGYYRTRRDTTTFTECPNPAACLGGVNSTCLAVNSSGHTGTLCASCLPGYAYPSVNGRTPPRCLECGNEGLNAGLFLLQVFAIVVIVAGTAFMNVRRGSDAVCLIKAFITYLQTASVARHLDLSWPESSSGYLLFMEKISSINLESASTQCLLAWNYYGATGFYILVPLILGAVGMVYFSVFQFIEDQREAITSTRTRSGAVDEESEDEESEDEGDMSPVIKSDALRTKTRVEAMDEATFGETWESHAFDHVVMLGVIIMWFMYPTLVQYLIGLLPCRRLDSGGDVFLFADLNIKCYDSTHNSWLFLFFLLLILYIIGIPVGLNALVQSEGELFGSLGMRYRVGILFKGHDLTSAWWWESVIFARKFLLATFVVAFCDSTRMGGYFIVWLLEASFVLHLVANPYANERKHRLESYGLLASIITFNCGILYREDYGDYVNTAVTLVLFATHIGMSLLLGKSMYEEFAAEGRNALIARAQHDIMLEEKIANEFEKRKASRAEMEREEEKQAKLNATIGAHLPFADDALLQQVETGTALEIKSEHKRLSEGLAGLRETWRERREKNTEKKYRVDEAHMARELTAVERWRERRAKEQSVATAPRNQDQGLRVSWRERMAEREREKARQERK